MLKTIRRKIRNVRDALESLLLLLLMPVFGAMLPWIIILWLLMLAEGTTHASSNEDEDQSHLDRDNSFNFGHPCLCGFGQPCSFGDVDASEAGKDS